MRPGGLGLEDIRHLLDSVDIEESSFESPTETNPTERIIGGYISPCMSFIVHLTISFTNVKKFRIYHRRQILSHQLRLGTSTR